MSDTSNGRHGPGRIVVGVDGSDSSRLALAWAANQSRLTGEPLTVVTAWMYPTNYGYPIVWPQDMDFAADATTAMQAAIDEVLGKAPEINLTTSVVEGHPSLVLVDESKTASLVVLGSRGHGEFAGMVLGSVSEFVATHAHCPVVIIREAPAGAHA